MYREPQERFLRLFADAQESIFRPVIQAMP